MRIFAIFCLLSLSCGAAQDNIPTPPGGWVEKGKPNYRRKPINIRVTDLMWQNKSFEILEAVGFWNKELGCEVFRVVHAHQVPHDLVILWKETSPFFKYRLAATKFYRLKKGAITHIYIHKFQWFRTVMAHELGHSLGLAHNEDPKDLMYAYTSSNEYQVDSRTINVLRTVYCE